jgi:hypothetical protein
MGKKRTRTTQTNRPIYSQEITGAAQGITNAYNASQPAINQLTSNLGAVSNEALQGMTGANNPLLNANTFVNEQLTGDLQNNPYLQQQIDMTNESVRNQAQAALGRRGLTGGSDYSNLIARALAQNETGLRYTDYNNALNRRFQAAGMAGQNLGQAAQLGQAGAMLPLQAAALQGAGVGGLLGQYQDVRGTQTQSGGLLGNLLQIGGQLGSAAIMACDERLKENVQRVGETPAGVPLYRFDYIGGARDVVGPMAQEVAILQPDALGPVLDGYMTVDMGVLR